MLWLEQTLAQTQRMAVPSRIAAPYARRGELPLSARSHGIFPAKMGNRGRPNDQTRQLPP